MFDKLFGGGSTLASCSGKLHSFIECWDYDRCSRQTSIGDSYKVWYNESNDYCKSEIWGCCYY
ncbi:hypothetical protein ABH964_003735 [Bacillus sp. RC92]